MEEELSANAQKITAEMQYEIRKNDSANAEKRHEGQ